MISVNLGDYVECEDKHGLRYIGRVLQIRPSSRDAKVLVEKILERGRFANPYFASFITKRSVMAAEVLGGEPEQYAGRMISLPDLEGRRTEWIVRVVESEPEKIQKSKLVEGDDLFSLMLRESQEKNRKEDESRPKNSPWGWL